MDSKWAGPEVKRIVRSFAVVIRTIVALTTAQLPLETNSSSLLWHTKLAQSDPYCEHSLPLPSLPQTLCSSYVELRAGLEIHPSLCLPSTVYPSHRTFLSPISGRDDDPPCPPSIPCYFCQRTYEDCAA